MAEAEELNISCLQQQVFLIVTSDHDQDHPSTSSGIRVPRKKTIHAGHRASATRILGQTMTALAGTSLDQDRLYTQANSR